MFVCMSEWIFKIMSFKLGFIFRKVGVFKDIKILTYKKTCTQDFFSYF